MAVRLFLTSGDERNIPEADGARADGPFFLVTKLYAELGRVETVLTLLTRDVVAAEILKDGVVRDTVLASTHTFD